VKNKKEKVQIRMLAL